MNKVRIEWSYDEHDCETCGWSSSQGAKAWVNDECVFDMPAYAHCYNGTYVSADQVYESVLNYIGYDVELIEVDDER